MFPRDRLRNSGCLILLSFVGASVLSSCGGIARPDFSTGTGGTPGDGDGDMDGKPGDGDGDSDTGGKSGDGEDNADTGGSPGGDGDGDSATCEGDDDCDDGLACNGRESCNSGLCVPGTPFDCDTDTTHCNVACVEDGSAPRCDISPKDDDADGEGSMLCVAMPGPDCSDDAPSVHSGAKEQCDGIDSNCNGQEDILEGFSLAGTVEGLADVSTFDETAAYSRELQQFGLFYTGMEDEGVAATFITISEMGDVDEYSLAESPTGESSVLAAGHSGFGRLYIASGEVHFERRGPTGAVVGVAQAVSAPPSGEPISGLDLLSTSSGWIASWISGDELLARRLDVQGSTATVGTVRVGAADAPYQPGGRSVRRGNEILFAFANSSQGVQVRRYSIKLAPIGEAIDIISDAADPALAASDQGYGIVFVTGSAAESRVHFAELTSDGSVACGPLEVSTDDFNAVYAGNAAIMADAKGFLVTHVDGSLGVNRIMLARIRDCTVEEVQHVVDDSTAGVKGDLELHASAGRLLGVWREPSQVRGYYRSFGINLCD